MLAFISVFFILSIFLVNHAINLCICGVFNISHLCSVRVILKATSFLELGVHILYPHVLFEHKVFTDFCFILQAVTGSG